MKITQKAWVLCNSTTRNKLTAQILRILPSSVFPFTFFQHFKHLNLKLSGRTCKIQSSYTTLGSIITLPEGRGFKWCFPNPVGWAFLTKFYVTPLEFTALEVAFYQVFLFQVTKMKALLSRRSSGQPSNQKHFPLGYDDPSQGTDGNVWWTGVDKAHQVLNSLTK